MTSLLDLDLGAGHLASVPAPEVRGARRCLAVLRHEARFDYPEDGARRVTQRLVTVPRARHRDQRRLGYTFRVAVDGATHPDPWRVEADAAGNTVHHVRVERATNRIAYETRALVVRDLGAAGATSAPWWPSTPPSPAAAEGHGLTDPGRELGEAAAGVPDAAPLDLAAELMHVVARHVAYTPGRTTVRTTADEAWALRAGVCQDLAHVLIAMCRHRGVPARYVSGHLIGEGASHAWVEAGDPATGAVLALDPTHDRETDLRYLTVAVGRDYAEVAPTRGSADTGERPGRLTVEKTFRIVRVA